MSVCRPDLHSLNVLKRQVSMSYMFYKLEDATCKSGGVPLKATPERE